MHRLLVLLALTAALFAAAFVAAGVLEGTAAAEPVAQAAPRPQLAQNGKQKCIKGCQDTHRDAVKLCNTLYPPKHRIEDHRNCLDKARTTFDACLATCQ